MTRGRRGFTLVELMAVLAILGILAAIAYPSYARQMVNARRLEAQLALLDTMQRQEQYRALHHAYRAFSIDGDDGGPGQDIAHCIELRARPGTANVDPGFIDADCGTLTLDSAGRHTASGPSPRCWP